MSTLYINEVSYWPQRDHNVDDRVCVVFVLVNRMTDLKTEQNLLTNLKLKFLSF
jgi:hypothetical protein